MLTTNTVLRTTISTSGGSFATDIPVLGGAAAAAIGAAAGAAVLLYGLPEEAAVFALPEVAEAFEVGADGIPELENAKDQPDGEPDDDNDDNDNQSNGKLLAPFVSHAIRCKVCIGASEGCDFAPPFQLDPLLQSRIC